MVIVGIRRLGWLCVPLVLIASTSCGLMAPSTSDAVAEAQNAAPVTARLPSDLLSSLGLEEIWYVAPQDGSQRDDRDTSVQSAYLIKEGLLLVTRPAKGKSERLLKMISRETGLSQWWQPVSGPVTDAPFAYHYPVGSRKPPELFFRVEDTIHCLDLRYGATLWSKEMDPPISGRVIANDALVFFGSDNHRFYAYRKAAGIDEWMYRTGGRIGSAPVLGPSKVVFASHDGAVYGVTPDQGWVTFKSWKQPTGARIIGDVASYSRWIFAGSTDYKLYCLEEADGTIAWSFVAEAPIRAAPVVFRYRPNQEYVYCIASEGPLDRARRTLFAVTLPKGGRASAGGVAAWRKSGVRRVVTMGRETLYVLNESGPQGEKSLSGLDIRTGKEKFRLPAEGFNFVPMNYANAGRDSKERGRIYLIARNGAIQVIGEKTELALSPSS